MTKISVLRRMEERCMFVSRCMFVTYLLARLLFTSSQLEDKTVCLGCRSEC